VREADALVELQVGADTVQATPEHPFGPMALGPMPASWSKATSCCSLRCVTMPVGQVTHRSEQPTTVYNVEVADWHTYLVSWWMFVVHDSKICIFNKY
jgi:hypothetical protein